MKRAWRWSSPACGISGIDGSPAERNPLPKGRAWAYRLLAGGNDDGDLILGNAAELKRKRPVRQVELDALAGAVASLRAGERDRMQIRPAIEDVDPAFRGDREPVSPRFGRRGEGKMAGERGRRLWRPLGRLRQSGGRERLQLERHRDVVGERAAVGKRSLVGANKGRALMVERPFKAIAARTLLRLSQARRGDEGNGYEPSAKRHCTVVTFAGASGLRRVSALAPGRN